MLTFLSAFCALRQRFGQYYMLGAYNVQIHLPSCISHVIGISMSYDMYRVFPKIIPSLILILAEKDTLELSFQGLSYLFLYNNRHLHIVYKML